MNKLVQTSLMAVALGLGSTAVFADDEGGEAARGGGGYNWGNCTSLGCEKDIPIKLEIPKKCEVLGGSAITLNKNGGTQSSTYTVRSSTSASTYVKHEDDGSVRVPTTIVTNKTGGGVIPFGNSNHNGLADDVYSVSVTNAAVSAFQRAGTYNDTYKIKVYY